jgi:glucosamine--fructose-6-phosphate aminotransferase (isomerizing)
MRAETVLISSTGVKLPPATRVIRIPGPIPEVYTPIPYIIPGQIFAEQLAAAKGLNPDKPRFLQVITRTI